MFELILNQPLQPAGGYNVFNQINRALNASGNHTIVLLAQNELNHFPGIELRHFTRDMLKEVWASNCQITTKYLATLWWGAVNFRLFNRVFSAQNMDRLQDISGELGFRLDNLVYGLNNHAGTQELAEIFQQMALPFGDLRVPYVGSAFFTKVLQFHVAAHQLNNQVLLPIIADRWMMMALYCEMTDAGFGLRDDIISIGHNGMAMLSNNPNSYIMYVEWYNNRCNQYDVSPWEMEGRLFRNPVVAQQYNQLIANR